MRYWSIHVILVNTSRKFRSNADLDSDEAVERDAADHRVVHPTGQFVRNQSMYVILVNIRRTFCSDADLNSDEAVEGDAPDHRGRPPCLGVPPDHLVLPPRQRI